MNCMGKAHWKSKVDKEISSLHSIQYIVSVQYFLEFLLLLIQIQAFLEGEQSNVLNSLPWEVCGESILGAGVFLYSAVYLEHLEIYATCSILDEVTNCT